MTRGTAFKVSLYHGVSIQPAGDCACEAVAALEGVRFLSDEAPRLPLDECQSKDRCHCIYRHFEDRRSELRRDSDIGLPVYNNQIGDRRETIGRRISDS